MKPKLEDFPLEIACPNCGQEIKQTLGWFKRDQDCPFGCGLRFNAGKFRAQISGAERAFEEFLDAFD